MSEEQLIALLARLEADSELMGKLKASADVSAALAVVQEAGFDVTQDDWLRYQNRHPVDLADEELECIAGGKNESTVSTCAKPCNPAAPAA